MFRSGRGRRSRRRAGRRPGRGPGPACACPLPRIPADQLFLGRATAACGGMTLRAPRSWEAALDALRGSTTLDAHRGSATESWEAALGARRGTAARERHETQTHRTKAQDTAPDASAQAPSPRASLWSAPRGPPSTNASMRLDSGGLATSRSGASKCWLIFSKACVRRCRSTWHQMAVSRRASR